MRDTAHCILPRLSVQETIMAATTQDCNAVVGSQTTIAPARQQERKQQPRYHIILQDDNDHTYEYVIGMLGKLFGMPPEKAFQLALQVDTTGEVIVDTTTLEHAELKRDQIHGFGRDWRIPRCQGSMTARLEPVH